MNLNRKNIRLKGWDYSSDGIYFVTICCKERRTYFGIIEKNRIDLSDVGLIAKKYWLEIPKHFSNAHLDEFTIMPNHIHGILVLKGTRHGVSLQSTSMNELVRPCHGMALPADQNQSHFSRRVKNSLSVIINQYKSSVKRWCNKNGYNEFEWQPRFFDEIVFDDKSIDNVRQYIMYNPVGWESDEYYVKSDK